MPKTHEQLERDLTRTRQRLRQAEDKGDDLTAELARLRCDALLDQWMHLPKQRVGERGPEIFNTRPPQ